MSEVTAELLPQAAPSRRTWFPPARTLRGLARGLLHDPFVHFLLLGMAIFAATQILRPAGEDQRITVRPERLAETFARQYGRSPTARELSELIERYVREEIYFREGIALGLQQDDEIVRRRVVQKYEFLQQDTTLIPEPDTARLTVFFNSHRNAYATDERISFTHVYFRGDGDDEAPSFARAERLKAELNATHAQRAPQAGDAFPELYDYSELGGDGLRRLFGSYPIVAAALEAPIGQWSGPYRSGYGWHLVLVTHRTSARTPQFDEVRSEVRDDFVAAERERRAAETLAKLRKKYVVEVGESG
jgi:peptidyl-prolyl cis-trans isomerase C